MKKLLLLLLSLGFSAAFAQQCDYYFPLNKKTTLEYTSYDDDLKPTGRHSLVFDSISHENGMKKAKVHATFYDKKDKKSNEMDYTVACDDNKIIVDMRAFVPPQSSKAYQDMRMEFTGSNLETPARLSIGTKLKDAAMQMNFYNKDLLMSKIDMEITERTVLAEEILSTSFGEVKCYKISYKTTSKTTIMGIPNTFEINGIEWLSPKYGAVKTESYKKNGKLMGSTMLTQVTQ